MSVFHEAEDGSTVKAYETGYPLGHVTRAGSMELFDPETDKGDNPEEWAA
eukprot:CAMPEP_0202840984 /NCGR_PEP_ID=MMETSP1389-20130828/57265_1 /ASSEMBLY_ACC=CAM_ASM_000865 /TAXON_ID=302021 /ORGANISM="Rhodomonas sp., Strain CCMP768" /LENGTH=49 /DNA_ID= /DNA_START= /DNA_END= /DNA_ORIENTATION=